MPIFIDSDLRQTKEQKEKQRLEQEKALVGLWYEMSNEKTL